MISWGFGGYSVRAKEYVDALCDAISRRDDVASEKFKLSLNSGCYDFLRIASKNISNGSRIIIIRAGLHGEEASGPMTILAHVNEILDYAGRAGLSVVIYPLVNPSGFEISQRFNFADYDSEPSDDFIRYKMKDGSYKDDLEGGGEFVKWRLSSDPDLNIPLSSETALMHQLIKKDLEFKIEAFLDLHQDLITPWEGSGAYHYAFGNLGAYKRIIRKMKSFIPIVYNFDIKSGQATPMRTDESGFIVRHDGTLPDLMWRSGVKHSITVETMGQTPAALAELVNLLWIYGVIDLLRTA